MRFLFLILLFLFSSCQNNNIAQYKNKDISMQKLQPNLIFDLAVSGDVEAQFLVGDNLCCGDGDEFDNKTGFYYLCESGKKGNINSQIRLGLIYEKGIANLLEKDLSKAHMWYSIASDNNSKLAQKYKNKLLKELDYTQINKSFNDRVNWDRTNCVLS